MIPVCVVRWVGVCLAFFPLSAVSYTVYSTVRPAAANLVKIYR